MCSQKDLKECEIEKNMVMKRILSCLLVFYFLLPLYSNGQHRSYQAGYPDQIILNVTADLSSSIVINWRTNELQGSGKVQIRKETNSNNLLDSIREIDARSELVDFKNHKDYYHTAEIANLDKETFYAYRVGYGENWSEWLNFKTTAGASQELNFLYFGDVQSNIYSMWSRVARQALRIFPEAQLALYAGDLVNRGNNLDEWEDWFTAGEFIHTSIPVMPASGNHDHADNPKGDYTINHYWNKHFHMPSNGAKGLEGTCYYADVEDVRFIVLNTEMFIDFEKHSKSQIEWLEGLLKTNERKWTILLLHHPIYSTKKNRDNIELRKAVKPLIDKYGVDLVLQGHDHTYARGMKKIPMDEATSTSNAMYVVSVSGPKLTQVLEADWMDRSASFTQLFHAISIKDNTLTFKAYKVDGTLYDEFVLEKREGINKLHDKY